jgi:ubiquinone biosynthesis protein UbiJ
MLTEAIENLLNRGLVRSPRARELCADLAGRCMALRVRGPELRFVLGSDGRTLTLAKSPDEADAEVAGTPLQLLALTGAEPEAVIRRGDVEVTGDAEIAQRFRELGHLLRPDLEEELSGLVGDAAAHRLAEAARGLVGFGRRAADTTVRNLAEYLAHERGDLVPRGEAEAFLADVDRLREDLDRLDARVALLEAPRTGA